MTIKRDTKHQVFKHSIRFISQTIKTLSSKLKIKDEINHYTYTALLEKANVRGTPLIERFLLRLLNSSSIRLLENIAFKIKCSLSGAPRLLVFSNIAL